MARYQPDSVTHVSELLPLFPLGAVLFPGMVLPLHIFEERYRHLVRDLLDAPEPRRFGVIAIREGRETGVDAVTALYEIGCVAELREADEHPDGRFDIITVGTSRFRLGALDRSRPYLQAEVEHIIDGLDSQDGRDGRDSRDGRVGEVVLAVRVAQVAFREYLDALVQNGGATIRMEELPDEAVLLSYVIAATMIIDLPERQGLLAEPDVLSRLTAERALLVREAAMLRATTTRPAPDLRYTQYNPN
jgi:Lon protease-like protein